MAYNTGPLNANKWLSTTTFPISTFPLTLAYWFNKGSTTSTNGIYLRNSAGTNYVGTGHSSVLGSDRDAGSATYPAITGTTAYSLNAWNHACTTVASATLHELFLNGSSQGTNTTNVNFTGINQIRIGVFGSTFNFDGSFAEVGVWSAALTQPEIASLADGMTCDKVRPQNLVFYAPLVRNLQDVKGGLTITNNNTATVAVHPRVYA